MEAMTKDGHKKMVDGSHRRKKGNVKTHQGEPQSQQGTRRLLKCRLSVMTIRPHVVKLNLFYMQHVYVV